MEELTPVGKPVTVAPVALSPKVKRIGVIASPAQMVCELLSDTNVNVVLEIRMFF